MGKSTQPKQQASKRGFEGSHPEMKGFVYTYITDKPAVDQFHETTEKLIEVVCSQFKVPQLLKACLQDLVKHEVPMPTLKESGTDEKNNPISTREDELKFTIEYKSWQQRSQALEESLNKTYNIARGQCNRSMKAKTEDDPDWEKADKQCDPITLLKIIKAIAHNNETQRNPTVSPCWTTISMIAMRLAHFPTLPVHYPKAQNAHLINRIQLSERTTKSLLY